LLPFVKVPGIEYSYDVIDEEKDNELVVIPKVFLILGALEAEVG
jgi:hypothetical protein